MRPTRLLAVMLAALAVTLSLAAAKKPKDVTPEKKDKPEWNVEAPPGNWRTISIDARETTWSSVDVSPDGSTVLFDALGDLWVVPIEGGEARRLTSGISWDFQPRFSPDGKTIAFISDRKGGDNLWIVDADGSNSCARVSRLRTQADRRSPVSGRPTVGRFGEVGRPAPSAA